MEEFEQPLGKFANTYGNGMVIDSNYFLKNMIDSLSNNIASVAGGEFFTGVLGEGILSELYNLDINHFAIEINGVLNDREKYYFGTPKQMSKRMMEVQTDLGLNMNKLKSSTPVKKTIIEIRVVELFLESIFVTIVFFMVLLSAMLIYSLMISDVDERTYEMGMLRALGLRTVSIVQLLTIQSLLFSLPGVFIGVTIAAIANVIIRLFVFLHSAASYSFLFTVGSAMLGVWLGLAMPLLTNIWAIQRALAKNIRESLSIFSNEVNEVVIKVIKLANYELSLFEVFIGITLSVMGILIYYIVPVAFLYDRLEIFFILMSVILVGMIIGLSLL
jgi:ABC-type antimicrobial peptide transport system permease subunit